MTALRADSGRAGLLLPMAALVGGGVCLGVAPVAVEALDLAPEVSAFYRVLLAAPVFVLSAMLLPRPSPTNGGNDASVGLYALAAFVSAADLVVMHLAIRMTDVAVATLLTNCAPFFVGLMGLVGLADKPRRSFWLALPIALVGAVLLILVGQLVGQGLVVTALEDLPVSLGSLVLLLQPVSAAALSWAWLGEVLAPIRVFGIAVVLLAIAGASLRSGS